MTEPITAVQTQPCDRVPWHKQHYTNMMQEVDRDEECYANTDSISKFDNEEKPMAIHKEPNTINYFLPGPNQDNDKRASAEITQ